MRRTLTALLLALALAPVAPVAHAERQAAPPSSPSSSSSSSSSSAAPASGLVPTVKPKVEIVFAIDTTGSMGGLIEGAKRKIWAIANEVASAKQKPEVRIGLVAFRDRGDAYVTEVTPLTDNLDAVYEKLVALRADGGGDGPEDVNAALDDAVHKMPWSDGRDVLRMVFLVGDAPPHMDYANQTQWPTSASAAVRRNIYINTVQCGVDEATTRVWRDIAHAAEGRYAAIPQDGGVRVAVATPFDDELGRLGHELDATNLTYGRRAEREAKEESRSRAASYAASGPAPAAADRAVAKAALSSGMKDSEDLVSLASSTGSASAALARVASDELPDQLRGKSKAEQQQILEDGRQKRAAIQKKIADASQKRAAWLAEQAKKAPKSATDSFDTEVGTMIRAEGAAAGLTW